MLQCFVSPEEDRLVHLRERIDEIVEAAENYIFMNEFDGRESTVHKAPISHDVYNSGLSNTQILVLLKVIVEEDNALAS